MTTPAEVRVSIPEGITLRDYFAVKIIQGAMSGGASYASEGDMAILAYKCADAMIEARKVSPTQAPE